MGGKVAGEWIVLFAIAIALFGLWVYHTQEPKEDPAVRLEERIRKLEAIKADLGKLSESIDTMDGLVKAWGERLAKVEAKQDEINKDLDDVQTHFAKLHDSVQALEKKTVPQHMTMVFKPIGAIPVEIMHPTHPQPPPLNKKPTKAEMQKLKKQIDEVSK